MPSLLLTAVAVSCLFQFVLHERMSSSRKRSYVLVRVLHALLKPGSRT